MPAKGNFAHRQFVQALQHEVIFCGQNGCGGPVQALELSDNTARVKTFLLTCGLCGWQAQAEGKEQLEPCWDEAAISEMAYQHLMHVEAACPFDTTPILFTSLPDPRRKAKYRLSCFFCGRQAEIDWPPPESRR
jgi:hypothetical protein